MGKIKQYLPIPVTRTKAVTKYLGLKVYFFSRVLDFRRDIFVPCFAHDRNITTKVSNPIEKVNFLAQILYVPPAYE